RDLSWLGASSPTGMSNDGTRVLISERSPKPTAHGLYPLFVRNTDGTDPVALGSGLGLAISPSNRWALSVTVADRAAFDLHPLGVGESRQLDTGSLRLQLEPSSASFVDDRRIAFRARESVGKPLRTYVMSLEGGTPKLLENEPGWIVSPVGPDGRRF